ncbi:GNAT family N-acetyltransferase [Nocardioidaceae bacterium]|nr:GNAT family N-acetyltransferase [Nocardioidaceae bacterium]
MDLVPGVDRDLWSDLALASQNVFATPEWLETWWRHYGSGEIVSVHDDRVVLPLHVTGGLVRQLRFIGSGQSDQLGPVCAPEHLPHAIDMLMDVAAREKVDVVLVQDVPVQDECWDRLHGTRLRLTASPVTCFDERFNDPGEAEVKDGVEAWERFVASRSRNTRGQLRKKPDRLRSEFADVAYRLADVSTVHGDLDRLLELHEDRWEGETPLASEQLQAFLHDFVDVARERGWLRLTSLELDGTVRAAQLDFRYGDHESCYQVGRDPAYDEHSLGYVLMAHCMEAAVADGAREFRFLRGNESYKYRFATHHGDVHGLAVARTLRGKAAVKAATLRDEPDESPVTELPARPR